MGNLRFIPLPPNYVLIYWLEYEASKGKHYKAAQAVYRAQKEYEARVMQIIKSVSIKKGA